MSRYFYIPVLLAFISCANTQSQAVYPSDEFADYWYTGTAEITSYRLEQARYGEIHEGTAALIFVTEPFRPTTQVKADNADQNSVSVMKLNSTKKFVTGIYPYSMMNSTFVSITDPESHALKITASSQEWCGHTFTQLNNRRNSFEIEWRSYFESEGDGKERIKPNWLEDELWVKLRLDPDQLPIGEFTCIPSFFYLRMSHREVSAVDAVAELVKGDSLSTYSITYPGQDRKLSIQFETGFPYRILGWEESYKSGWGENAKTLTTRATKTKTMNTPYWQQNQPEYRHLHTELGLD